MNACTPADVVIVGSCKIILDVLQRQDGCLPVFLQVVYPANGHGLRGHCSDGHGLHWSTKKHQPYGLNQPKGLPSSKGTLILAAMAVPSGVQ